MCDCEKKLGTDRGVEADNPKLVVRKLARTGTKLLHNLPSERDCAKIEDPGARTFVAALRNFALDASQANSWDQRELGNFSSAMALADSAADALLGVAFARNDGDGGGGGRSCTFSCKDEKDKCLVPCAGIDWPCFCCADCRLAYLACLADCIVGQQSSGGGTVIV